MKRILLFTTLLCWAAAHAGEWHVDEKAKDNQVEFTSEVAGFSFAGATDKIDGFIYWEGKELFEKNDQLLFEIDLATLDSGIGKRDRDMRKVLETDKWPKATFKGRISHHERIDSTVTAYRVKATGHILLHGVERALEVPGTIVVEEGRSKIDANFVLKLTDFKIKAPSLAAFIKVGEEVLVAVSFYMKHVQ